MRSVAATACRAVGERLIKLSVFANAADESSTIRKVFQHGGIGIGAVNQCDELTAYSVGKFIEGPTNRSEDFDTDLAEAEGLPLLAILDVGLG